MKIEDALVILLEATMEMDDQPEIRRARKRMAQKVESLRLKRERANKKQLHVDGYCLGWTAVTQN
jgi:hypothetical protein